MELGWVIVYVRDPRSSVDFYERAFGLERRFVHESGEFAELDTGGTRLSFATLELGDATAGGVPPGDPAGRPANFEIALTTDDVAGAVARARDAGAAVVKEPELKPWGQTVAYVRDPDGTLIEVCTPVPD
jgi:catechol 2,3-dioxygenase-like lactoylglutathione lyase family enzyme